MSADARLCRNRINGRVRHKEGQESRLRSLGHRGRSEVLSEPAGCKVSDPFQGARLLKQVRGPGDYFQLLLAVKMSVSLLIQAYDHVIAAADD